MTDHGHLVGLVAPVAWSACLADHQITFSGGFQGDVPANSADGECSMLPLSQSDLVVQISQPGLRSTEKDMAMAAVC